MIAQANCSARTADGIYRGIVSGFAWSLAVDAPELLRLDRDFKNISMPRTRLFLKSARINCAGFGAFLGTFGGVSCLAERISGKKSWKNAFVGGFAAGLLAHFHSPNIRQTLVAAAACGTMTSFMQILFILSSCFLVRFLIGLQSDTSRNLDRMENEMKNPGRIRNKCKRAEMMTRFRQQKKDTKKRLQAERRQTAAQEGDNAVKLVPRTLENTREADETMVSGVDSEIAGEEADDEFSKIFDNVTAPKLMITTRPSPSGDLYHFLQEIMELIPNSYYYKRGKFDVKDICRFASNKDFSHVMVFSEREKKCNGVVISKLPAGPTAFFKISNVVLRNKIQNYGKRTSHQPELILNNFDTRLGHRVGRFLGSLFPHAPQLQGRQVVTFHNQRDYIFVRQHRYVFDTEKKARLQELGPQFTLKLRWLQEGRFDTKFGEYEWMHKRKEMDTTRRRFHL